jgi:hypothetical protein
MVTLENIPVRTLEEIATQKVHSAIYNVVTLMPNLTELHSQFSQFIIINGPKIICRIFMAILLFHPVVYS